MEIAIKEIICMCDCTSDPLFFCVTLEVKVIATRLISLLLAPCRLGSRGLQSLPWTALGRLVQILFCFGNYKFDSLQILPYISTTILALHVDIHLQWLLQGSVAGICRLVLAGRAAVTRRALQTRSGAVAVPLEHSHGRAISTGRHCVPSRPLGQAVMVFLPSPSGFVTPEEYWWILWVAVCAGVPESLG